MASQTDEEVRIRWEQEGSGITPYELQRGLELGALPNNPYFLTDNELRTVADMMGLVVSSFASRMQLNDIISNNMTDYLARLQPPHTTPEELRLESEAFAQNIDFAANLTEQELRYVLSYDPLDALVGYVNDNDDSDYYDDFIGMMENGPFTEERLRMLKKYSNQRLGKLLDILTITENNPQQPRLYLLWAMEVINEGGDIIVPTSDPLLYTTAAGSEERLRNYPEGPRADNLYCRDVTDGGRISLTVMNTPRVDNDIIGRILVSYPAYTTGRWTALAQVYPNDLVDNLTILPPNTPPEDYFLSFLAVGVLNITPATIGDFNTNIMNTYTLDELILYAQAEGINVNRIRDSDPAVARYFLIGSLLTNRNKPSFYHPTTGAVCSPDQSVYGEEFTELPLEEVYAYGPNRHNVPSVKCYHRDELTQQFISNRKFEDPVTHVTYTKPSIARLNLLLSNDRTPEAEELRRIISALQLEESASDAVSQDIVAKVNALDEEKTALMKQALQELVYLGMYMRRWDGPPTTYPLGERSTLISVEPDVIQERVHRALAVMMETLAKLPPEDKDLFWNLPLKWYRNGEYTTSTDPPYGLTIGQRIEIVVEDRSTHACIRMSSSWLLYSAIYWGLLLYGTNMGVNVNEIAYVT